MYVCMYICTLSLCMYVCMYVCMYICRLIVEPKRNHERNFHLRRHSFGICRKFGHVADASDS